MLIESVVPLDPVFTSKNYKKIGIGAWEIAVKYSVANLNSKTKFGKLLTYGLGLNWYLNENIKHQLAKHNKIKKQNELNKKIVYDFIHLFINLNNREPMETEIIDNLKDQINQEIIKKILNENKNITIKNSFDEVSSGFNAV